MFQHCQLKNRFRKSVRAIGVSDPSGKFPISRCKASLLLVDLLVFVCVMSVKKNYSNDFIDSVIILFFIVNED